MVNYYSVGEPQYLMILNKLSDKIKERGFSTNDRTGVGTCKIFGEQMRFDLSVGFPLFTHKQVFMRGIFEELMWFLRGQTNIKYLVRKGVNIWNEWAYKAYEEAQICSGNDDYLNERGFIDMIKSNDSFADTWGDIGKAYGYQWRNFGETTTKDFIEEVVNPITGEVKEIPAIIKKGFDQIEWLLNEIKTNPDSRRLIVTGWNPHDVDKVALPPCHTLFQFFTEELTDREKEVWALNNPDSDFIPERKLSCQLYQRSADILLGVPFNIASYSLLTHLIAQQCGMAVGEFIWSGGDIHVYSNQEDGLNTILKRKIYELPKIKINKRDSLYHYEWSDIELLDYKYGEAVPMPVAV